MNHVSPGGPGEQRGRPGDGAQSAAMNPPVLPLHLGALHPFEQALVYTLAFGPFLLLGIVIAVRRRQERREDDQRDR
ncbi:MAG: hypothetical protein JWO76_619 [Nocardioides sp.]|nr:hypothetical protein [Nocardioides sp.]